MVRKLTNGSGALSRQSEVTFSATGAGNRLSKRFIEIDIEKSNVNKISGGNVA